MVYMYSFELWESPNPPYTPYTPNTSNELNTSSHSGFSISLKKLILTRCNARGGKQIEPIETLELLRGLYESNAWNGWNA